MNICDMKLHYFQTSIVVPVYLSLFYYHTKLHYSQTVHPIFFTEFTFDYHMKLHYSQTTTISWIELGKV